MTRWIPVLASRLQQRRLICADALIERATLFPFFDAAGSVAHALVVDGDSSDLRTFRLDTTRAVIPLWGPIRLVGPIEELHEDVLDLLAPLWHFDPRWLLTDARFESQTAVPILKLTNCSEAFDQPPADLLFSARLTSVRKVRFPQSTDQYESRRFHSEMLPTREATLSLGVGTPGIGWQLDPVW